MRFIWRIPMSNTQSRIISRKPTTIPNDTAFGQQWGLNNTGAFAGGTPDADIDASEAWNVSTGSRGVIIAVIDTGVDYTHPDLVQQYLEEYPTKIATNGIDDDANGISTIAWDGNSSTTTISLWTTLLTVPMLRGSSAPSETI